MLKNKKFDGIRGLIFDMDGVLCDSERFIAEAACRMFEQTHGRTVLPADFEPFVGMGEDRYLGGVAHKYGIALTMPRDKEQTYRLYADCVKGNLNALPGVLGFIRAASDIGLKLAVATSADRIKLKVNLWEIGLDDALFDALVTGSDVTRKKPAPDLFLKASEELGLAPHECIVFEDAVNGVQAAKAAGAHCIGITSSFSSEELLAAGADRAADSFLEFLTEIEKTQNLKFS